MKYTEQRLLKNIKYAVALAESLVDQVEVDTEEARAFRAAARAFLLKLKE